MFRHGNGSAEKVTRRAVHVENNFEVQVVVEGALLHHPDLKGIVVGGDINRRIPAVEERIVRRLIDVTSALLGGLTVILAGSLIFGATGGFRQAAVQQPGDLRASILDDPYALAVRATVEISTEQTWKYTYVVENKGPAPVTISWEAPNGPSIVRVRIPPGEKASSDFVTASPPVLVKSSFEYNDRSREFLVNIPGPR